MRSDAMAHLLIRNEILEDLRLPLEGSAVVVGRGQDAGVRIDEKSVSRFHARLECDDGIWFVTDLGSSNGTFVNGERTVDSVSLGNQDVVRFGHIDVVFEAEPRPVVAPLEVAPPTRPAASETATDPEQPESPLAAKQRTVGPVLIFLASLLVCAVCAVAIHGLLDGNDPDPNPDARDPITSVDGEEKIPASLGDPPGGGKEAPSPISRPKPSPTATTPTPRAKPVDKPVARPGEVTVKTKDGRTHRGRRIRASDPAFVHLKQVASPTLHLPMETVASIDGSPVNPDLNAIFAGRLRSAGDTEDLLHLIRWCAAQGLTERRQEVARMIVEGERDNPEANAILGRYRYKGKWSSAEELKPLGCLDGDRLVGTRDDLKRIRRVHFVAVGRSPTTSEILRSLGETPEEVADRLLAAPDHWHAWLAELLVRFLGPESGTTLLREYSDLPEDLAEGNTNFKNVFMEIAGSDAVRVRYPTPRAFAERTLAVFIGEQALQDADLLRNAVRMIGGERVPVFGERGSSREDFLDIIARQAAFYRWQIRYESRRYLGEGHDPTPRELTRGAMRLAVSPTNFSAMRKKWLLALQEAPSTTDHRIKDDGQFVRGLLIDAFQEARPQDEGLLRQITRTFSAPTGMRSVIAALVSRSPRLWLDSDSGRRGAPWVEDQFRRLLGRAPTPAERDAAVKALSRDDGARSVIASLLQSPEYQVF